MSSPGTTGDPRARRERRVVKARTFKHGTVDPVIAHRRPLLTWGNAILVAIMVGFGLYATGNLPQLDAFFDRLNTIGRAHNNTVVGAIIAYGPYLFAAVILAVFALFVFLFINSNRRQLSDPKGWHKVADAKPQRRHSSIRRMKDLPSMVHPIGKHRPNRASGSRAARAAAAASRKPAEALSNQTAVQPQPARAEAIDPLKAAAIAAAAKADAAAAAASPDLPSFVRPLGKTVLPPATAIPASPAETKPIDAKPIDTKPTGAPTEAAVSTAAAAAKLEAAIAAAKAAAARAEATIAAAKAEAAIAEAAMAAAKAEAAALPPNS